MTLTKTSKHKPKPVEHSKPPKQMYLTSCFINNNKLTATVTTPVLQSSSPRLSIVDSPPDSPPGITYVNTMISPSIHQKESKGKERVIPDENVSTEEPTADSTEDTVAPTTNAPVMTQDSRATMNPVQHQVVRTTSIRPDSDIPIPTPNYPSTSRQTTPIPTTTTPISKQPTTIPTSHPSTVQSPNSSRKRKESTSRPRKQTKKKTEEPKKGFRFQAKYAFLTYPRCDLPREDIMKDLQRIQDLEWALVAQEHHEDEGLHLHAVLKFKKQPNIRSERYFDVRNYHPNIQVPESLPAVIKYCQKQDTNPLIFGTVPHLNGQGPEKKEKVSNVVATMIKEGKSLMQINELQPGYLMIHQKKIIEYQSMLRSHSTNALKEWNGAHYVGLDICSASIAADWFSKNIKQVRKFKQQQLYISGPTDYRKTSLIRMLSDYIRIYWVPMDEDFYDEYDDNLYDLICFDEFYKQKSYTFMNKFTEGGVMYIKKKGSQILKSRNLPVVILSNYTIGECYPDEIQRHTMSSRFMCIHLNEPIDLDSICLEPVGLSPTSLRRAGFEFIGSDPTDEVVQTETGPKRKIIDKYFKHSDASADQLFQVFQTNPIRL